MVSAPRIGEARGGGVGTVSGNAVGSEGGVAFIVGDTKPSRGSKFGGDEAASLPGVLTILLAVVLLSMLYLAVVLAWVIWKIPLLAGIKGFLSHPFDLIAASVAISGTVGALATGTQIGPRYRRAQRESLYYLKKQNEATQTLRREREHQEEIVRERLAPVEDENMELRTQLERVRSEGRETALLQQGMDSVHDVMMLTEALPNKSPLVLHVNAAFERMTGYTKSEILRKSPGSLLHGPKTDFQSVQRLKTELEEIRESKDPNRSAHAEILNYHKNGSEFWVELTIQPMMEDGQIRHWMSIQRDITEQRKADQARKDYIRHTEWHASHDVLTGLHNRKGFQDCLVQEIENARKNSTHLAVLFFNVDRFKHINDSLGLVMGDQLLKAVGERLQGCAGDSAIIARMGGDVFLLLLPGLRDAGRAEQIAQKVLSGLREPFDVGGNHLFVTASIGISVAPQDGTDVETLLRNADVALHCAKDDGRDGYRVFDLQMNTRAAERLEMDMQMRTAVEKGELFLLYQPQVDLKTGQIYGVEALLRWENPRLGKVMPMKFIPLAEETGQIVPIGEWVLREACWQAAQWQKQGRPLRMAVNVSDRQVRHGDLIELVQRTLQETGLDPSLLEIELTERILMEAHNGGALHDLKRLGVQLSVDDFGTGYSNLQYLTQLPLDVLKIDRAFVSPLESDRRAPAMVQWLVNLAHANQLHVIAEGVETEAQRAQLCSLHCNAMQGYLFSPPVGVEEIARLMARPVAIPDSADRAVLQRNAPMVQEQAAPQIVPPLKRPASQPARTRRAAAAKVGNS